MKIFLNKLHDESQLGKLLFFLRDLFPGRIEEIIGLAANRSRPQENYYRKWSREFGKHVGLTPAEMHDEILCLHFGSEDVETPFGIKRRPIQRSNTSNREEYTDLIETLVRVAAEMDFSIPEPRHDDA